MYHLGKVIKIYRSREKELGIQATLEMWDENILTLEVDKKISKEIRENSYVFVDYRPISGTVTPMQLVKRVLSKEEGPAIWERYKQRLEQIKRAANKQQVQGIQDVYR